MSLRNGRQVQNSTLSLQLNDVLPAGVTFDFAGTSAPAGFLLCDGSAVSRTTYVALFNNISTTYGIGDGVNTFNLPDSRGRVHAGKDDMGGVAANRITNAGAGIVGTTLGAVGGAQTHTMSSGEMPSHAHSLVGSGHSNAIPTTNPAANWICSSTAGTPASLTFTQIQAAAVGGGTAHNNTQPTLIMNKIIKY